ncbi:Scr1 family TA system antitoxin-like transcriptional regulator [Streptomyces sp. NPDC015125]|uniref:Scr1 family TA system antitoxin-like transcriptional regulator n=1 Tax=Streptomyces sp. NPDC015125 TaxID=3364938 RepID=UPI0036FBFB60
MSADATAQTLRDRIEDGTHPRGSWIMVHEVAEEFGATIPTASDALTMLASANLLTRGRRGTYVVRGPLPARPAPLEGAPTPARLVGAIALAVLSNQGPPTHSPVSSSVEAAYGDLPTTSDLADRLADWRVDEKRARGLLQLLAPEKLGRVELKDMGPGWTDRLAWCERAATQLRYVSSTIIPRAFQTPAYAAAIAPRPTSSGWEPTIERDRRQNGGQPTTLILDNAVLKRPTVGPTATAEQLRHLLRLGTRGALRLRVLGDAAALPVFTTQVGAFQAIHVHGQLLYACETSGVTYRTGPLAGTPWEMALDEAEQCAMGRQDSAVAVEDAIRRFDPLGQAATA